MSWAAFIPRPAVLLGVVAALAMVNLIVLHYCGHCFLRGCSPDDSFQDNIGNVDTKSRLSYPRIDVVYTWVNGSDPRWRASKERYLLTRKSQRRLLYGDDYGLSFDDYLGSRWRHAPTDDDDDFYFRRYEDDEDRSEDDGDDEDDDVDENNVANSTVANATAANATSPIEASNQTNATAVVDETTVASEIEETVAEEEKSADDAASESRFRDSEELRYSLRSLEMFAPWIHKVYIVTDNQIPYWLNLDDPKVELVPHSAIFEDKSLLPVFSSPAIESQLHRVPGVSRRFVYFNDDVMLGAPTFPDDFYNLNGAQRVYLAWEVPKCNEGCHEHWLGDGTCDSACNVSSCGFDYPDCEGVTEDERKSGGRRGGRRKSSSSSSKTKQSRSSKKSSSSGGSSSPRTHKKKVNQPKKCATGCVHTWLGDGTCDKKCDVASCMYDLGDCGGTHTLGAVGPGTTVVEVPVGAFGVVVNVSDALLSHELDDGATLEAFVNDDSREVVTDAFVLLRSKLLIVFIDVTLCRRLSIVARTARRSAMKNSNLTTSVIPHYDVANWTATVTYATTGVSRDGVTNATYYNETEITYNFHLFDPAATSVENSTASMAEKKKRARDDWLKKYRPSTTNFDAASCGSAQQQSNEAVIVELGTRWSVEVRMSADSENFSVEDYDVIELISVVTHNKILPTKTLPPVSARLVAPLSSNLTFTIIYAHLRRFVVDEPHTSSVVGQNSSTEWMNFLRLEIALPDEELWTNLGGHNETDAAQLLTTWKSRFAGKKPKSYSRTMQLFVSGALFIVPKQNNVNASESAAVACAAFNVEAVEPTHLFDDDSGDDIEIEYSDDTQSRSGRRLLLDTYGESLTRVNRLYTQRYGKPEFNQARRVPAHMPHLLDTEVIKSMQSEWAEEWRETARNRFRSGTDMQYAFSYFHYIMSKAKNAEPDFDVIWKEEVDTNGDGILDGNEIITLASLALGKEPDDLYISEVYECVATQFSAKHWLINTFASRGQGKSERQRRWETRSPRIATLASTKKCERVVSGVTRHAKKREERRESSFHVEPQLHEVAFEMLGDDYNSTRSQLDSIRARRSKFICINDNINEMTPELFSLLRDFFTSYYPRPSRFELPDGVVNRHLRLEDHLSEIFWRRASATAAFCFIALILAHHLWNFSQTPQEEATDSGADAADRRKAE